MVQDPASYYDETYKSYVLGWSSDHFHYGFWYENTSSHEDSLANTTKEVVQYLDINEKDIVLDAGCGTGGSSRYIANHIGAKSTGIMLSEKLLEVANELKKQTSHPELLDFYNMDYNNTDFENDSFTKIFGLESICYAQDKKDFAQEAYRLLKPGGKIVVADGFLLKEDLTNRQQKIYDDWKKGWAVPNLILPKNFKQIFTEIGFTNVVYYDKTPLVRKSSVKMARNARFSQYLYFIAYKLKMMPASRYYSARSAYLQKFLVNENIVGYGILYGEKSPSN